MNRGFLEIPFAWLFAIIVGATILFLTIFVVTKVINTGQTSIDAQTAKQIGVLLNPLETGFESGQSTSMTLPSESRIYNLCNNLGNFGQQGIRVSQLNFGKWTETNVNVIFENKYIFSENYTQGKSFFIFSKRFDFPFKVADLIYMTSRDDKYCFSGAPQKINDEISALGQGNLLTENCPKGSINICFDGGTDCNITVDTSNYLVKKNGQAKKYYGDALMYAAIFSDPGIYECQFGRLMNRVEQLANLYEDKTNFISRNDCNSNLNLLGFSSRINGLTTNGLKGGTGSVIDDMENLNQQNSIATCRLW